MKISTTLTILLLSLFLITQTSCRRKVIIVNHDNGKHKGWFKNPHNPHNPNSNNPGNGNGNGNGNKKPKGSEKKGNGKK